MVTWLAAFGLLQAGAFMAEASERKILWKQGNDYATSVGRPFLVVGMPRGAEYSCSPGVTLDLDPAVIDVCGLNGVASDIRAIPYPDGYFGAALASHVLEHLPSIEDAAQAWRELWRVSPELVLVAYPRQVNLYAQLLPGHKLWITPQGRDLLVVERATGREALISP